MRCEIEPSALRNSLKRFDPSPSVATTRTVHLSLRRKIQSAALTRPRPLWVTS
jgi:hypothetical protein